MSNYRDNDNITTRRVSLFGTSDDDDDDDSAIAPTAPIVAGSYIENPPMQYSAVDLLRILGDRIQMLPSELNNELLNAIASALPIEEEWVVNALVYVPDLFC
jgi:hypothetical protein